MKNNVRRNVRGRFMRRTRAVAIALLVGLAATGAAKYSHDANATDSVQPVRERACAVVGGTSFCADSASVLMAGIALDADHTARMDERAKPRVWTREALEAMVEDEAAKVGMSGRIGYVKCLIQNESGWNPTVIQYRRNVTRSIDRGLFQINDLAHPKVSTECALDPVCAARWSLPRIKDGSVRWYGADKCK
jgi:hypothetical protein